MTTPASSLEDPATCSALNEARLVHVALGMEVDMARRVITSVATLRMQRSVSCVELTTIQLDVLHLRIQGVQARAIEAPGTQVAAAPAPAPASDDGTRVPLQWAIKPFTSFGEILSIQVPESLKTAEMLEIVVEYETSPSSPAVCWLDKEQTAGKTHPFVYTQGQEVLNRSFFPCQDSPSVRITYDAKVTVPSELVCVMSASQVAVTPATNPDGSINEALSVFTFEMHQSIPVYLVAMAVGNLASTELEFDGIIEKYLSIGERLFGEYLWERYDVLVMPPSFPYGAAPVQANVVYLSEEAKQWPVFQLLYFLDCCFDATFASTEVIITLGDTLNLWKSSNTEVLFRWSQVLIKNHVESKLPYVQRFLTMQGKQKFQIPIYRLMVAAEAGAVIHQFARGVYALTRAALHVMPYVSAWDDFIDFVNRSVNYSALPVSTTIKRRIP
ncbi:hypothetical protein ATCC90586_008053 [Pythium insidiosum]|nr:hypothetical protein ATCC90586_008053 [Pythium insidiosum]